MNAGVLSVLKPPGMTSHDVVDFVRRFVPRRARVGHAGTLDPSAAGVLVICLGAATRLAEYLMEGGKEYRAEVALGVTTDTLDADGTVLAECDASSLTEAVVRAALATLVGPQLMAPPMYSAARVRGERLYDLARRGESAEPQPRPVTVHSADLVAFSPGARATALADIRCSKGTYIRVLAAQLGERLGVGAHLSFLVRTAVGCHLLRDAVTLEEIAEAAEAGRLAALCLSPSAALAYLPEVQLSAAATRAFANGSVVPRRPSAAGLVRVSGPEGRLVGIGEVLSRNGGSSLTPRKVLAGS
jgi:tRNA pseudouridine55 synthase